MNVSLNCNDQGFGFWLVGGSEDGTQVTVGFIEPGGSAALDGRLQTGDEIIFCNNECVINASHKQVAHIIRCAGRRSGHVSLTVRRRNSFYKGCHSDYLTLTRRNKESKEGTQSAKQQQQQITEPDAAAKDDMVLPHMNEKSNFKPVNLFNI
ncbi:membrane-associated guanylate kinase, WW and PDZ domain-containing protein 2-like [Ruditapes philippinarum]|uniref:membrane-associated guanylate kinase, WW and PDZ domain-containing protein 2-like n=1 Tax=Ruditapes philippinarum TaxID=129788 RepID=UPI00295C0894|nr:membrane-associated guanylate kinase, WW and PDZ domain-containing protein 2-like [Ruditapes philippinarum]